MSELRARLRIDGDASGGVAAARQMGNELKQTGQSGRNAGGGLGEADSAAGRLARSSGTAREAQARLNAELASAAERADQAARGLGEAAHQAGEFDRRASGAGQSAALMYGAIAAGAALGGRALVTMTGQWSDLDSRVRIASEHLDYSGDAMARLTEMAARTYSSLERTAESWLLNAVALDEWGFSAERGLDYTEALNNALVVSGARGQRAETVINAMSRAMALGELRGTELNTVIMNGGRVTQALAEGLGVTNNELRTLGQQGFLTTERVVDALTSQFQVLKNEADAMPATIEDGITRIGTSVLRLTGQLDQTLGASGALAEQMVELSNRISEAADDPEALAEALERVWTVAQLVGAMALARWLAGVAVQTRASAAAWVMKGQAAEIAARNAALGATQEAAAVRGLHGAIVAAAQAELNAARASVAHTASRVQAAAAAVRAAQVELALASTSAESTAARARLTQAEAALTAARNTQVAAAGRAAAAEAGVAAASTRSGAAMAGMGAAGRGLVGLFGGPWMLAFTAAAGVVWALWEASEAERRAVEQSADAIRDAEGALDARLEHYKALGIATALTAERQERLAEQEEDAGRITAELTGEVELLADERMRAAAAAKAQDLAEDELARNQAARTAEEAQRIFDRAARNRARSSGGGRGQFNADSIDRAGAQLAAENTDEYVNLQSALAALARADANLAETQSRSITEWLASLTDQSEIDRRNQRIRDTAEALTLEAASLNARTAAAARGEQAMQAWQIAEAGRQAVTKAGLQQDDDAAAGIRAQAEAVERLRIETERVATGWDMARQAERDIEAFARRTAAMAEGRDAMDALRVEEAGINALRRIGLDTLDGLTTRELAAAEAARDHARAREAEAIAAERAQAALAGEEQLDRRIAAEERRMAAVLGGTLALAEHARAEFIRQEVERRGLEVTDEAAEAVARKAAALWDLTAATDAAQANADWEDDLRLMRLSTRERNLQLRTEELILQIRAQQRDLSEEALETMARARAEAEVWAEDWALAASEMEDMLRESFINSGELSFSELGDMLERELRRAIYDAMLAEPISILVNATVNNLSGALSGLMGQGGKGGLAGIAGMLGDAGTGYMVGQGLGLGTGNVGLDAGLSLGGAALGGIGMSAALGTATGTALGGMLGGKVGAALTAVAGPLGALAGLAIGSLLGGLLDNGSRPISNAEIVATPTGFQVGGQRTHDKGPGKEVGQLADAISQSLNAAAELFGIDMAKIAGLTTTAGYATGDKMMGLGGEGFFGGTYKGAGHIDQVVREGTSITQVQSAEALAEQVVKETILRAIAAGATDLSEAEQRFVQTAKSLEEAVAVIERSRGFAEAIDLAILQFSDPAEWQKQSALAQIEATYKQLKSEAEELIAAGLVTGDILARIERLRDVQVADALGRLAPAADEAASALERIQAGQREWLDRMAVSALAPTSPQTQREEAFRAYEAQLALADAGDEEAMRQITRYAERLLTADREATTSASARAELYALVMGDIGRLSAMSPVVQADSGFNDIVEAIVELPDRDDIEEAVRRPVDRAAEVIRQAIINAGVDWHSGIDKWQGNFVDHSARTYESLVTGLDGMTNILRDFSADGLVTRVDVDFVPFNRNLDQMLDRLSAGGSQKDVLGPRLDTLNRQVTQLAQITQDAARTQEKVLADVAASSKATAARMIDLSTEQALTNSALRQSLSASVIR